ncbi:MAG TPA: DUF4388 domain-containing protein [Vicinamibacteria bacterium]|nr:DUF4388 domain-containing protein [Vicinamibacteria bacterium]
MRVPEAEPEGSNLTLRGRIEDSSVPELLRSVLGSGETGVLTFRGGQVTKSLYLHMGRVVYAKSSNPDERMGESLLLQGKITVRQYLDASQMIRPGRRLGTVLVEMGALEPEDLLPAVEQHVKEILLDVFTWTRGEYELIMSEPGLDDVVTLNFSMENLILEGIRRTRSWGLIYRGIGTIDSAPVPTGSTEVLHKLELTDEEQEVLTHVTGRASVEQICQVSYLSNLETCRILWAFHVLGVIRRGQAEEAVAAGAGVLAREREMDLEGVVEKFNQMLSRIYAFLRGRSGDDVDDFVATALQRVSGRYETLFYGLDLKQYGRADYDQMLANVADLPPDQRKSLMLAGLNELVGAIQLGVRERHGAEEEAVVSGIIRDGFRKLGA